MTRVPLISVVLVAFAGGAPAQDMNRTDFSAEQRAEVITILRDALRSDPSILRDAITALQESDRAAKEAARREALTASADALFRDPADPEKGNPRGDVTIVEFFDVRCGYCRTLCQAAERNHLWKRCVLLFSG